jgi:membrane fusion protein, multidrug efflux system
MSGEPGNSTQGRDRPAGANGGTKNPRVRIGLAIAGAVIVVIGLIYGIRWMTHGRYIIATDDAYLRADVVTVAPRVSGYIQELYVRENQSVQAGQPLLRIDTRNYRDALSQQQASADARQADITAADSQIKQQEAGLMQQRAQLAGAQANTRFASAQAQRYRFLRDQGVETEERYQQAENQRDQMVATEQAAVAAVNVAERQLVTLKSQKGQALAQMEAARASVSTAQLNLDDTLIRASVSGVIGDDTARVGQYVQPGTRLLSIVPMQSVYLVGNFKETQLERVRIGQPATIKIDALGGTDIHGEVASFAPGTGAQFALLPPENATGNFIKIVQRVPVRLSITPPKELASRLLPGLSATVSIDTTTNHEAP